MKRAIVKSMAETTAWQKSLPIHHF